MKLTVSRVASLEALRPEWEQLDRTTFPRLPFSSARWTSLWLRHFAEDRALIKDELMLLALRDETGVLRGLAPMVLSQRPSIGPVRTRMLRMIGADPNITELSSPICAPEHAPVVLEALLKYLDANDGMWDLVFFNGIRESAANVLEARGNVHWGSEQPCFVLKLPPTWDALRAQLGRNLKESLRKCYNSLKRDNHHFELRVRSRPDEMVEALDHFFRLHNARSTLTGTTDHKDVFALERSRLFLRDCMAAAAGAGEARVFQLEIGGQVVATRLAFALDDQLYLYFSGFDPAWKQYSVMTTTVAEAIRWAIEQRFAVVNLSPGRDVSKTRWDPVEIPFREVYLPSQSLRGGLVHRAYLELGDRSSRLGQLISFARRHAE
ncbi:MAG: GNAT family N-acetyltransferase [Archangium sp.]|nr:GNAT family N-acetyltransferase [Archangium sp.]MDP3157562.1 GNAT family N-acetyltransferase [Archangium sp.]MDP3571962.1 GNAT family N-acetyltransferase [Archangium sp.]